MPAVLKRLGYWLAERLRPWYDNGLGEELELPALSRPDLVCYRENMRRSAALVASLNCPFGIFALLGMDCGRRAARAWRPGEFLRMEDVSLAFHFVEQQRHRGILVEPIHIDRLVETLFRYFDYQGETRTKAELRRMINDYLEEHSAPDAEPAPGEFGSVRVNHALLDQLHELSAEMRARFPNRYGMSGRSRTHPR